MSEALHDTIATPKSWRLMGRSGQPPPNGGTPGWTATRRTLSASASRFDHEGAARDGLNLVGPCAALLSPVSTTAPSTRCPAGEAESLRDRAASTPSAVSKV